MGQRKMSITRNGIIETLVNRLEPNPSVLALWLEGADATGHIDQYSDLDICCSVRSETMSQVAVQARQALETLGELDLAQQLVAETDTQHWIFHVTGSSPYLLIDFNLYVGRGSQFVEGDDIEKPFILFDKSQVIHFVKRTDQLAGLAHAERIQILKETVAQYSRLDKYVQRGEFLEAFGYYEKWLLIPLIEIVRIKYTPLHADYFIVHISRHLPEAILRRLEDLFKVNSVAEIGTKSKAALIFFDEIAAQLGDT